MTQKNSLSFDVKRKVYRDATEILSIANGCWKISNNGETLVLDEKDKPSFANEATGELVVEFTGMATDKRSDRSWAKAVFKERGCSPCHYHNEREEYYYIMAGTAKVVIDAVENILSPGQYVKILPKQRHQIFSIGVEPLEMMVKCAPAWVFEDQHVVANPQKKRR